MTVCEHVQAINAFSRAFISDQVDKVSIGTVCVSLTRKGPLEIAVELTIKIDFRYVILHTIKVSHIKLVIKRCYKKLTVIFVLYSSVSNIYDFILHEIRSENKKK